MPYEIALAGCSPIPLASYLKALGILRLVAEQADVDAQGYWRHDGFALRSRLDEEALRRFLLDDYHPTPILAPWNGGSGFFFREEKLKEKDPTTGKRIKTGRRTEPTEATKAVERIASGRANRTEQYRKAIWQIRAILTNYGYEAAPEKKEKASLIEYLRATLPDNSIHWLDSTLALTTDGVGFAPMLGSGGNDGNFDFSSAFIKRLIELFDPDTGLPSQIAELQINSALFNDTIFGLGSATAGQFDPGSAGGPNAHVGFEGNSRVNAWDFVLMLEGALLFAAAATRRLGHSQSGLSYPFTVQPTGSGSGATAFSDEDPARAETWMPLWENPATLPELDALLREGRVRLGARLARDGLDFARAVASLGVERGITAFQRYAFMKRSGDAYLATPLNYIPVRENSNPATSLIDQLDDHRWLSGLRRLARDDNAPGRIASAVRQLEDALFELTRASQSQPESLAVPLQSALIAIGRLLPVLGQSPRARERCPVLPKLGTEWMEQADDGSHEFRLAAALAGLHAPSLPMRAHIVALDPKHSRHLVAENNRCTWTQGPLTDNLSRLLTRRMLQANQMGIDDKPLYGKPPADLAAVAAFLRGETRDDRIAALIAGLSLLETAPSALKPRSRGIPPLPAVYALMKPLFSTDYLLRNLGFLPEGGRLPLPPTIPRLLTAGSQSINHAVKQAIQRRQGSGLPYTFGTPDPAGMDGLRLLAALMIPLSANDTARLIRRTLPNTKAGEIG
ncbi:MAG TPA: type I-U CRISPR-associated protein Csx17 [Nitrococcus sp.]|nr:type I-U CRISPR-associated protein Csx17 [Nitrococcus sp.]